MVRGPQGLAAVDALTHPCGSARPVRVQVERGVAVPAPDQAAFAALAGSVYQPGRGVGFRPTPGAVLAGGAGIERDDLSPGLSGLPVQDGQKVAPSRVADGPGRRERRDIPAKGKA